MKHAKTVVLVAGCLVGCAMTRSESKFDYQPQPVEVVAARERLQGTLIRGLVVTDHRRDVFTKDPLADSRVLLNKRNGYGYKTLGVYAVDKPLAEFVHLAFQKTLEHAAVVQSLASPFELHIQINALDDPGVGGGFFKGPTPYLVMAVNIGVVDKTSGRLLWKQGYVGKSEIKIEGLFFSGEDVVRALPTVLADILTQCLSSPAFRIAISGSP